MFAKTPDQDMKFEPGMREISGFGGGYEQTCRNMILAGAKHLCENPEKKPRFRTYKGIYGIIDEENEEAKDLTKIMLEAANGDCTGAQMQTCVSHVLYIRAYGWEKFKEEMKKGDEK